jgi:hypothetical protein
MKNLPKIILPRMCCMAYYNFLKSLRSLEEFRKNPHIKIPPKSPPTNFQSLVIFKNPIFILTQIFLQHSAQSAQQPADLLSLLVHSAQPAFFLLPQRSKEPPPPPFSATPSFTPHPTPVTPPPLFIPWSKTPVKREPFHPH